MNEQCHLGLDGEEILSFQDCDQARDAKETLESVEDSPTFEVIQQ